MNGWVFAETIENVRRQALLSSPSFETISESVAREMEMLCCHCQRCDDDSRFSRVVFCIRVSPPLFDVFFNSENGYRGAYYRSPCIGIQANEAFIHRLASALLRLIPSTGNGVDQGFAFESLRATSAKVWLAEHESHLCERCMGEWGPPQEDSSEICNDRWEREECPKNGSGKKAPYLSKLRIFGGFLNARHDEFIPSRKRDRAMDIHRCGWS